MTWNKPKRRPKAMSAEEFSQLADCVKVREVHFPIRQQGCSTKEIIVVTTLLDAKTYTKAQLAKLYQLRWEVEVDLRHVKTTLGMDELRGKTPQMERIGNLCASDGLQSATHSDVGSRHCALGLSPLRLSLQGTEEASQ